LNRRIRRKEDQIVCIVVYECPDAEIYLYFSYILKRRALKIEIGSTFVCDQGTSQFTLLGEKNMSFSK